jgi:formylglycine-generating enzyme required for sulfatase activity
MMLATATAVSTAQDIWSLLDRGVDNTRRSSLIQEIPGTGPGAERLVERLLVETTPAIRSSLILALGGYDAATLAASLRQSAVNLLLTWYAEDVDPGVHGAVAWLFGQWGKAADLAKADESQAGRPRGKRRWFVTEEGQTMTMLEGPSTVRMGSPADEPGRQPASDSAAEPLHTVTISRTFAIAAREVTRAEFGRFMSANPDVARVHEYAGNPGRMAQILETFSPEEGNPAIAVTWYEAAMYCNWLSERARLPKHEWVYPIERSGITSGMEMPPDYLHRTGYRLPTEAEWEFSARAGTTTARFFGSSDALLPEYATFSKRPRREAR